MQGMTLWVFSYVASASCAGGAAERGRAHAPPLSLRGRSAVGFCLFRPVICLLLMMLLFLLLLLFFFFLLL